MLLVILLRSIFSTVILKYPLLGGLLAIILDYIDLNIIMAIDYSAIYQYQEWDKVLDLIYLSIEAYIVSSWRNKNIKIITLGLFIWRLIGVILFEITELKYLLFIFPNIFEVMYIFYLLQKKLLNKDKMISIRYTATILIFLSLFKLFHEYLLHINTTQPWTENEFVKYFISNTHIFSFFGY